MQATTVAAQGTAETDYDQASFSLTLSATGQSVPAAKTKLQKMAAEMEEGIAEMQKKTSLEFVKNSLRKNSEVHEQYEWIKNKNEFRGYEMTYSLSFLIDDLDKVSDVYDALTSLPNVRVARPNFLLKNRDRLNKRALKDAWKKVTARFEDECDVLGLRPDDFEIGTWEVSYSDSHRSGRVHAQRVGASRGGAELEGAIMASAAGGGAAPQEPLEIVAGKASVTVNLEVAYAHRANTVSPAVKATLVKPGANEPGSHDTISARG